MQLELPEMNGGLRGQRIERGGLARGGVWGTLNPPMPYVEYACEGRLLFRTETTEGAQVVPRVHEVVVIDDEPYQVVDVEYWARRMGSTDRRYVWPTVYVIPLQSEEWELRLARRNAKTRPGTPPVRY